MLVSVLGFLLSTFNILGEKQTWAIPRANVAISNHHELLGHRLAPAIWMSGMLGISTPGTYFSSSQNICFLETYIKYDY